MDCQLMAEPPAKKNFMVPNTSPVASPQPSPQRQAAMIRGIITRSMEPPKPPKLIPMGIFR